MKRFYTIFTSFLLASTIAFAEGESGCKWETIEETDEYIMESCGDSHARIRQKHNIETIFVPQKEKLV